MLIQHDSPSLRQAFADIRKMHARSGREVTIFVSRNEVDSLSALKILTALLREHSVTFSVFPVAGYDDLYKREGQFSGSDERALVFLNCGATDDLCRALDLDQDGGARAWVIDCHRPISLDNMRDDNKVVRVICDQEDANERLNLQELDAFEDSDSDSDSEGEGEQAHAAKRARREARASHYLRGNFFGRPCGSSIFELAKGQYKHDTDMVWHALVALEDHFLHDRMDGEEYQQYVQSMLDEVKSLESSKKARQEVLEDGTRVRAADLDQITESSELRLPMLRHWSLYESLMHSQYVATTLRTWTTPGQQKVDEMLARMGVPQAEAKQRYAHMSIDLKNTLGRALQETGDLYGLDEVVFTSFSRQMGYAAEVSASDVVEAASAALELAPMDSQDGFNRALEVLSLKGCALEHGLSRAMQLHKAVMQQAGQVLLKKGCKSNGPFFLLDLEEFSDHDLLCHPLALSRLAHFLLSYHQASASRNAHNSRMRFKPFIVIVPVPGSDPAEKLVMGLPPAPKGASKKSNKFELAFKEAFEQLPSVTYVAEGFDGSIVQIPTDALSRFLSHLKEVYWMIDDNNKNDEDAEQ